MGWEPGRRLPPEPPPVERTVWRVCKDVRAAEGRVRVMAHGHELRIVLIDPRRPEEQLAWSCLYLPHQSEELRVASDGTLRDFERLGWTLAAEAVTPS